MQDMSTGMTQAIESTSLENTLEIAAKIGEKLRGGEVIELVSDLGGGKTAFVRGLAKGMGSNDQVASPTFTLSREYRGQNCELHHFDFYRLDDPGVVKAELEESIIDPTVAVAIEWADVVHDVLPEDRLTIAISQTGEGQRRFSFTAGEQHQRLLEGLS